MAWREEEILIVVKVYPSPSKKYGETVCTAGITKSGQWIRLYPVPYRDLPFNKRFKKFQWIKAKVQSAKEKLNRPESHKIDPGSIALLAHVPAGPEGWNNRKKYFLPLVSRSLEELWDKQQEDGTSLGMFKPKEVYDFKISEEGGEWDSDKKTSLGQVGLFSKSRAALEKIPHKFYYKFACDDPRCRGHELIVLDWEAAESYRNFKAIYGSEETTLEKMKEKWLTYFFRQRESYFVVGTDSGFGNFMILTIISPERKPAML